MGPNVVLYGHCPWRPAPDAMREHLRLATHRAALGVDRRWPGMTMGFVDVGAPAFWAALGRLCRALGRPVRVEEVPFVDVGGLLVPAVDVELLAAALDRLGAARVGTADSSEAGSWEGFLSSPGMNLEYMRRVDREIDTFNVALVNDPKWGTAPVDFRAGWPRFVEDWKAFYKRNEGFFERTFADVYDDTKVYEEHLHGWRARGEDSRAGVSPSGSHGVNAVLALGRGRQGRGDGSRSAGRGGGGGAPLAREQEMSAIVLAGPPRA
jgi:hypothetical protein